MSHHGEQSKGKERPMGCEHTSLLVWQDLFKQQKTELLPETWIEHATFFLTKGTLCHQAPQAVPDVGKKECERSSGLPLALAVRPWGARSGTVGGSWYKGGLKRERSLRKKPQ